MPRTQQIIPEHRYPHQMVVINDNSKVTPIPSNESGSASMLFVVASPKGIDRKVRTITGGLAQFLDEYGIGPFSLYGQPLLNAYTAFSTGKIIGHVLRVTALNASYAYSNLMAKYKVDVETGKMTVKFYTKNGVANLTDLDNLAEVVAVAPDVDEDGFTEVKLLSVAALGRGGYGNKLAYRIGSLPSADKENRFKNYTFDVYENETGFKQVESFSVIFSEDAIIDGISYFTDSVINSKSTGSKKITVLTYPEGFAQIYNAYKTANPDTTLTLDDFDVLLGINKYTKQAIVNYTIDTISEGAIAVNGLNGIALENGSDGDFDASVPAETRQAALEQAYQDAFSGKTDPMIKSKNKFPTNLILDANYSIDVKKLIAALAVARTDCVAILDCGTEIKTKASVVTYVQNNLADYVTDRVHMIDAYAGKVYDPYQKIVTVTSTYALASAYPALWANNDYAKHVPLAGNVYGVLSGFIEDSIYPVFDEDVDSALMDELVDLRINFARLNAAQNVIRATQTTRQEDYSYLSEANNVFVLLDIKRDCEKLVATYEYSFNDAEGLARFNRDVNAGIVPKYAEAQVSSISASFSSNEFEAARGILHLNVEFSCKDLVKITIIEIDINRAANA